jgi:hypothetical protein
MLCKYVQARQRHQVNNRANNNGITSEHSTGTGDMSTGQTQCDGQEDEGEDCVMSDEAEVEVDKEDEDEEKGIHPSDEKQMIDALFAAVHKSEMYYKGDIKDDISDSHSNNTVDNHRGAISHDADAKGVSRSNDTSMMESVDTKQLFANDEVIDGEVYEEEFDAYDSSDEKEVTKREGGRKSSGRNDKDVDISDESSSSLQLSMTLERKAQVKDEETCRREHAYPTTPRARGVVPSSISSEKTLVRGAVDDSKLADNVDSDYVQNRMRGLSLEEDEDDFAESDNTPVEFDDLQSKELWESVWSQGRGVLCVDRQIGSQSYVEYDEEESSGNYESESAESTGISTT